MSNKSKQLLPPHRRLASPADQADAADRFIHRHARSAADAAELLAAVLGGTTRETDPMLDIPRAILAVQAPDVDLGDVTDAAGDLMHVTQITRAADGTVELGGHPHGTPAAVLPDTATLRRPARRADRIRVWREPAVRLPKHAPRTRQEGRRWVDACSCGHSTGPHASRVAASRAWTAHKAQLLTEQAMRAEPGLRAVTELETAAAERLPRLPWTFRSGPDMPVAGAAHVHLVTTWAPQHARDVVATWAQALGAAGEDAGEEWTRPTPAHPHGCLYLWAQTSHLTTAGDLVHVNIRVRAVPEDGDL